MTASRLTGQWRSWRLMFAALLLQSLAPAYAAEPLMTWIRPDIVTYPQYFSVAQGVDRLLYLGGTNEVLRFDGARWIRIPMPHPGAVRALHLDRNGRIWVGSTDCFGYLMRESTGEDRFVDVSAGFSGFGAGSTFDDIWESVERDDGIYFRALRHIFHVGFDGKALHHWHYDGRYGDMVEWQGRLLVQFRGQGLKVLDGEDFAAFPGGEAFATPMVYGMVDLGDERLLIHDVGPGLRMLEHGRVRTLPAPSDPRSLDHLVEAMLIAPGRVAFAGDDGIVRILDPQSAGIESIAVGQAFLADLRLDREGALLVVSDHGIARVPWPAQWSAFGPQHGLRGTLHASAVIDGKLYALSGAGVYVSSLRDGVPADHFEQLPWTSNEAWALLQDGERMLLAESRSLLQIDARGIRALGPDDVYPRTLLLSPFDPDRLWVGTEQGYVLYRRDGDSWQLMARDNDLDARVLTIAERTPGELWLGSEDRGVLRVHVDLATGASTSVDHIGAGQGLAVGEDIDVGLSALGTDLYAASHDGVFRLDGERFVRDEFNGLASLLGSDESVELKQADDGSQWAQSYRGVYRHEAGGRWEALELAGIEGRVLEGIATLPGGRVVVGAGSDLLLYSGQNAGAHDASEGAGLVIASVRIEPRAGRRFALPLDQSPAVDAGAGAMVFDLGFTDFAGARPPQFQVRLIGLDKSWSEWTQRASVTYGALAPGSYSLEARARRRPDAAVSAASYRFTMVPHWYQRTVVQVLGVIALLALVASAITRRQQARVLRMAAQNRRLDFLIDERTAALASANDKLRDLAERDGLTGVANRRRFDAALAERFEASADGKSALSVLLADVDHFKGYNDAHGHLAGDELLKRMAASLVTAVREETLVARYGGEEFALVAAGCDAEKARQLAERLRAAVAESSEGLTISVGVATLDRRHDRSVMDLLKRADAALYAAKRGGRNRVEVDMPSC